MLNEENESVTEVVEESPPSNPSNQSAASTAPPAPSTDLRVELDNLSRQTISEQSAEIVRLQRELASKNATPVVERKDDPSEFLNAPRTAIRDEVRAEVQAAVQPLIDFTKSMQRETAYTKLVEQVKYRAPALFAAYQENQAAVDQLMQGQEPSPQNIQGAILMAQGARALGLTSSPSPNNPSQNQPRNELTPPNIPPSPPPPPRRGPSKGDDVDSKVEAMTESERAWARKSGFKDMREYIQFRDAPQEADSWKEIK